MKLLLVAATKAELSKVFEHFCLKGDDFIVHSKFDILITGVGMTATAFAMGKYLNDGHSLVLNVGIAGSFNPNLPLGGLVNIVTDTLSELGAEDHQRFLTINQLGFGENTYHSSYSFDDLLKVKGITVNKVHGNSTSIAATMNRFKPEIESMEGAAVFYACKMSNIKCLQIRAISNYVEPRNKENWQTGSAIDNLNNWIINFIENR